MSEEQAPYSATPARDRELIRMILESIIRGAEDWSSIAAAGYRPEVIFEHIRYCTDRGLISLPDLSGEVFEPGFEERTRVTEKGRAWLESNQTEVS